MSSARVQPRSACAGGAACGAGPAGHPSGTPAQKRIDLGWWGIMLHVQPSRHSSHCSWWSASSSSCRCSSSEPQQQLVVHLDSCGGNSGCSARLASSRLARWSRGGATAAAAAAAVGTAGHRCGLTSMLRRRSRSASRLRLSLPSCSQASVPHSEPEPEPSSSSLTNWRSVIVPGRESNTSPPLGPGSGASEVGGLLCREADDPSPSPSAASSSSSSLSSSSLSSTGLSLLWPPRPGGSHATAAGSSSSWRSSGRSGRSGRSSSSESLCATMMARRPLLRPLRTTSAISSVSLMSASASSLVHLVHAVVVVLLLRLRLDRCGLASEDDLQVCREQGLAFEEVRIQSHHVAALRLVVATHHPGVTVELNATQAAQPHLSAVRDAAAARLWRRHGHERRSVALQFGLALGAASLHASVSQLLAFLAWRQP
eukprot:scaffold13036_cov60-Phaeocystis_antarctica.AAC.3